MHSAIKNIIDIIESMENRINAYWNFYVVVVVATVGWLLSADAQFTQSETAVLTLAVTLFFAANLAVIATATKRVVAFQSELNALAAQQDFLSAALKKNLMHESQKNRLPLSYLLHIAVDIAVIYTIWSKLA